MVVYSWITKTQTQVNVINKSIIPAYACEFPKCWLYHARKHYSFGNYLSFFRLASILAFQ